MISRYPFLGQTPRMDRPGVFPNQGGTGAFISLILLVSAMALPEAFR
jgi:hypothetical protein